MPVCSLAGVSAALLLAEERVVWFLEAAQMEAAWHFALVDWVLVAWPVTVVQLRADLGVRQDSASWRLASVH